MPISFNEIMMNRAKAMAARGMRPEPQEGGQGPERPQPGPQGPPNPGQMPQGMQMQRQAPQGPGMPQDPSGAPVEGGPQQQMPQMGPQGQQMNPIMGALMRRMPPPPQEGADPRMFLNKLPKEIADLAIRYRRI